MRISTNQFYQSGLNSILDQQSGLNRTQQQIATGQRVQKPSDDPIATISIINLEQEISLTNRYIANGDIGTSNLGVEETVLQSFTDILQRVRELILSGGNATYGDNERNSLAVEMDELLSQMVGLANQKSSAGDYMFSGNKINVEPFTKTAAGSYQYNGDQGVRNIQISTSTRIAMNDSGYEIFQNMLNGNGDFVGAQNLSNTGTGVINEGSVVDNSAYIPDTYTIDLVDLGGGVLGYDVTGATSGAVITSATFVEGGDIAFNGVSFNISGAPAIGDSFSLTPSSRQDIFTTVQNALAALTTSVSTPAQNAQMNNALQRALIDLDQGMEHIGTIHAEVGTRLNVLDSQKLINIDFIINSRITLSSVRDLDMAEAITDLNLRKIGLEAAQASFVRIQNLSLFNFLR
ncbi:MAG: flagellar hook-associated protein 3 [Gammaproteobacteria bacterium]|nr:MAG: flagellar hook-associated protein 3 [Gammaproteobacteria bacterium]